MADLMRVPVDLPAREQHYDSPNDLGSRINQIFVQKGAFRNVTEEGILNESSSETSEDENDDAGQDGTSDDEHDPEKLLRDRNELLQLITESNVQINSALDFISMILSQKSQIAKGSFSEGLRQAVGPGMFDSLVLTEGHAEPNVKSLSELSLGWKSNSFSKASDSLLAASQRMQKSAEQESSFWSQVASINEQGWQLSRHPRAGHVVGVHFGSAESAPQFRTRGFAVLRRDGDSELFLDRSGLLRNRKRVCVAVIKNDRVTGSFTASMAHPESNSDIENQIANARDDLFDEELFHEISREARLAANQGITPRGDDFEFSIDNFTQIRVSLRAPAAGPLSTGGDDDALAMYISLTLRSLLVQAHRDSRLRRSLSPLPISTRPAAQPEYALLRPLIAKLRHDVAVLNVRHTLTQTVIEPLQRAGLTISFESQEHRVDAADLGRAANESIVSVKPQITAFMLKLPTERQIKVRIRTYLGRPVYGTSYEVSEVADDSAISHGYQYDDVETFLRATARLATLDITTLVAGRNLGGNRQWTLTQPRKGILTLPSIESDDNAIELSIHIQAGTLVAQIRLQSSQKSPTRLMVSWTEAGAFFSNEVKALGLERTPSLQFMQLVQSLAENTSI